MSQLEFMLGYKIYFAKANDYPPYMQNRENEKLDISEYLTTLKSGTITVGINGRPLLKADADSRSLDLEISGIKESGIKLSKIMKPPHEKKIQVGDLLKQSEFTAKSLHEKNWKLGLYDRGHAVLTMGRGVSRLTSFVSLNPLEIPRLLEML